jgi:hypothetical protein
VITLSVMSDRITHVIFLESSGSWMHDRLSVTIDVNGISNHNSQIAIPHYFMQFPLTYISWYYIERKYGSKLHIENFPDKQTTINGNINGGNPF